MSSEAARTLLGVVVVDAIFLALVVLVFWAGVFLARRFGGSRAGYGLGALGIARPSVGYVLGAVLGLAVGFGALLASLIITPLSFYVAERLGYSTESQVQGPLMQSVREWVAEHPGTAIPAAIFVMVVFAPAVEEIIFRGALFGGLYRLGAYFRARPADTSDTRKKRGSGGAVPFLFAAVLSSAFFALLHFEPVILPALSALAIALCALYHRTGSVFPTFVAHATFNSLAVLVIILSGLGTLPMPPQT